MVLDYRNPINDRPQRRLPANLIVLLGVFVLCGGIVFLALMPVFEAIAMMAKNGDASPTAFIPLIGAIAAFLGAAFALRHIPRFRPLAAVLFVAFWGSLVVFVLTLALMS